MNALTAAAARSSEQDGRRSARQSIARNARILSLNHAQPTSLAGIGATAFLRPLRTLALANQFDQSRDRDESTQFIFEFGDYLGSCFFLLTMAVNLAYVFSIFY